MVDSNKFLQFRKQMGSGQHHRVVEARSPRNPGGETEVACSKALLYHEPENHGMSKASGDHRTWREGEHTYSRERWNIYSEEGGQVVQEKKHNLDPRIIGQNERHSLFQMSQIHYYYCTSWDRLGNDLAGQVEGRVSHLSELPEQLNHLPCSQFPTTGHVATEGKYHSLASWLHFLQKGCPITNELQRHSGDEVQGEHESSPSREG